MKKLFVLFPLVLMLAACGEESKFKEFIRNNFKDSGVAKEIISFKGILLGKPNATSSLMKLCVEEKLETDCSTSNKFIRTTFGKLERNWDKPLDSFEGYYGKVHATFVLNNQDEIDSINLFSVKTSSILETIPLLEEKYGTPESTTQPVQNRFGSKFENKYFKWKDAQGNTLQIWSIDEKLDEGLVIFNSAAKEARTTEEEKKSEKTAKSNL